MKGYMKTTGKKYNSDEMVKCSCGKIFLREEGKCPNCGGKDFSSFQRTLATVKEENEANE